MRWFWKRMADAISFLYIVFIAILSDFYMAVVRKEVLSWFHLFIWKRTGLYIYKYSPLLFQNSLIFCIQQWHNTLPALDLCLNLATKLPWDILYAGRLNPFMAGMEITLLLTTGSLNKWKQEAVWYGFGKGTLLP